MIPFFPTILSLDRVVVDDEDALAVFLVFLDFDNTAFAEFRNVERPLYIFVLTVGEKYHLDDLVPDLPYVLNAMLFCPRKVPTASLAGLWVMTATFVL